MGLKSIYGSGPDEEEIFEEIFRLTNPKAHPSTGDSVIAQEDVDRLATSAYDAEQDQFDEQDSKSSVEELIARIDTFSREQVAELLNHLQHGR